MIPGIDDGAPDMESALETLAALRSDGVTAVVATPHLQASRLNGPLRARCDAVWPELVQRAGASLPDLELYRGYEINLDTPYLDLSDPGVRLAGSRFALVEFYSFTIPFGSVEMMARIVEGGCVPIIAHPERYWGYDRNLSVVSEWRRVGALLQLNSGSILGEYGGGVRAIARHFLSEGWADVIASDNHARPSRSPSLRPLWDYLVDQEREEQARLLLITNPRRILKDEMPEAVGSARPRKGLLSRLARVFRQES